MTRKLKILAPVRYPWLFNGPRAGSRHDIDIRYFVPFNKISDKIEGVTVFNPWPLSRFDLVHAFNRIPLGMTPYVIGFESHLPRAFWFENTAYYRALRRSLAGGRCRGIVAISEYARRHFLAQHEGSAEYDALAAKLSVRYPNLPMPEGPDAFEDGGPVRLVFVGNHFGRKGGPVSVRIAEIARQQGLDVHVDIVSSLETGAVSWTDPVRPGFFDRDFQLLRDLPNITHHGALPNKDVLALVRRAHFVLLPTFSDTFGYSVIEAMAQHTPAIVTKQGALPEFVKDGVNGIVLDLENTPTGEWKHIMHGQRDSAAYEALFRRETERLAHEAVGRIAAATASPAAYLALRKAARGTAEEMFSATDAARFWDDYYERAVP